MARKAVQGFPEKSYYDNTRYLGIVATTDPLNEGLFKHMVNFDVSDTGQSVKPREGFLTTVLKNVNHISLSNNTIIYKDNNIGDYILFDITANVAYIADISGYNVPEYYLPIKSIIANKDWDLLFTQVLIPNVSYVRNWYNSIVGTAAQKLSGTITEYIKYIKAIPDTKIEHIYDEDGISRALVKVTLDTGDEQEPSFNFIMQLRYRQFETGGNAADTLVIEGLPYMFEHPTLAPTERNLAVSKSIIPTVFQNLYTEPESINPNSVNPVPSGSITTLGNFVYVYDAANQYVNNFIERGKDYTIKPYFSLNPAAIQLNNEFQVFRTGTRTSGSTIITNINVEDIKTGQQVIGTGIPANTTVTNVGTTSITISLAATASGTTSLTFILNNNKWAYKVEFFNTSTEVTDKTKEVVFSSPWMSYDGVSSTPVKIFNTSRTSISLGNEDPNLNHYQGSRFVIFIVPKATTITTTSSDTVQIDATLDQSFPAKATNSATAFELSNFTIDTFRTTYSNWKSRIDKINNLKSLRDAIRLISANAVFHVYNLTSSATKGEFEEFESSLEDNSTVNTRSFSINAAVEDTNYDMFLNGDKLIEFIETNNIFKSNYNITFKLLPFATKDTLTTTAEVNTFNSNSSFDTRTPYYFNQFPTDGENSNLKVPVNTFVQVINTSIAQHGYVYKQTSGTTSMTYTQVSTTGDVPNSTFFVKGAYYFDDRRDVYYQWNNATATIGSLTSVSNPTTEKITTRWFFASLNYWSGNSSFADYLTKNNVNINSDFFFFKKINNQTSLEANISELGNYSLPVINFQSAHQFGAMPIRIDLTTPGVNTYAPYLTRVHSRQDNKVYEQSDYGVYNGLGNNWVDLGIATNGSLTNVTRSFTRTNNSITITGSTTSLYVGMSITGTGITNGTTITSITDSNTLIMSLPATASGTSNLTFNNVVINLNAEPYSALNNYTVYNDTRTNTTYRWYNTSATVGTFTPYTNQILALEDEGFFDKGVTGIFYMKPYNDSEFLNSEGTSKNFEELETLKAVWGATSFTQTFNLVYTYDKDQVTFIEKFKEKEALQIQTSNTMTVFEDSRLLTWYENVLYISEEGKFYWFKERNRVEFGEEIVKVLQYKQIILVFTRQHLYAVYRVETVATQLNTATNQIEQNVTGSAWLKQTVLYNLLVNTDYTDVIQIFNQMILFYSEDGQLFMIRPSSQIDDQTRFSIQYFNKAANDILKNYEVYINERLASYGSPMRVNRNEIKIKALVSINFIKIIYYVPGVITYMLIYDVINNRYTAYDTLTFTNIFDKRFIDSGDLFITEQNNKLYFTLPYVEVNTRDNYVDMSFTNNFKKEGINCLIDTGNMNLNNHLFKRFRDLHVTFKNLNAGNVLFNLETMIDEIVARPFYNEQLQVIDSNNVSYYVTVKKEDKKDLIELVDVNQISEVATDVVKYSLTNNLFENNNMLMDFSEYTSSKLLTHRTSILGLGKVFRLKLQFISKGLYKLQNFGIIYKERRV